MIPSFNPVTPSQTSVDVVMPVFNERPEAIEATLDACLGQTYPISHIFVIDDGSVVPAAIPERLEVSGKLSLTRLHKNQKNAAARTQASRNAPLRLSPASIVRFCLLQTGCRRALLTCPIILRLESALRGQCLTIRIGCFRGGGCDSRRTSLAKQRVRPISLPGTLSCFAEKPSKKVGRYNVWLGNVSEDLIFVNGFARLAGTLISSRKASAFPFRIIRLRNSPRKSCRVMVGNLRKTIRSADCS